MSRLAGPDNPFTAKSLKTGHVFRETGQAGSQSDTIQTIFTSPPLPKPDGQRQNNLAKLVGIENSLSRLASQLPRIDQSDQPLAAGAKQCFRRFEQIPTAGRMGRPRMATLSHFFASLIYGVFFGFSLAVFAVPMAKPEV
jgi:hypothetical protein